MTAWPVCVLAQHYPTERQPFQGNNYSVLRSPGDGLPNDDTGGGPFVGGGTGGGGPWDDLPNDDEGTGGWVGMSVRDACSFVLLLAVGYGLYRRRRRRLTVN